MNGPMNVRDDARLESELRSLGGELALPQASTGFAAAVTARIEREAAPRERAPLFAFPRLRRGVLLALAATLILAVAAAAAVGWRLPGLEIFFGPAPSLSPSASLSPSGLPGSLNGLGAIVSLEDAQSQVDFPLLMPPDLGPPDATYVRLGRVAMLWSPQAGIPATDDPEIGLLLNEFRGRVGKNIVEKIAHEGTLVERITVNGAPGYWIGGAPHYFVYIDANGREIDDTYRSVSQTLVWTAGGITFRLETSLGRDDAIRLAESLR